MKTIQFSTPGDPNSWAPQEGRTLSVGDVFTAEDLEAVRTLMRGYSGAVALVHEAAASFLKFGFPTASANLLVRLNAITTPTKGDSE